MRKMASIRKIDEIRPIPEADAIECAVIGGWTVVVKKGEFNPGDMAIYCEIDSWVPHELAPFLGRGSPPKEYEGVLGYRLRTIKLRGQLSQGLLLPLSVLPPEPEDVIGTNSDVSEILNIRKYEPPIPAELSGAVVGPFPTHLVPKTDEERVQNLDYEELRHLRYVITEKLDGTSATFIKENGALRVCGRNWEWQDTDNTYWQIARKYDLLNVLKEGMAVQGEIIGPGVQGNKYGLKEVELRVFSVWQNRNRLSILDWIDTFPVVPILTSLGSIPKTVDELLKLAEAKSELNVKTEREGIVLRAVDKDLSFKAISNKFLIKNGE